MASTLLSEFALSCLADGAVKSTILLFLACGLAFVLMRKASAGARHLIWTSALIALLVLPAASLMLPSWSIPIEWPETAAAAALPPTVPHAPVARLNPKGLLASTQKAGAAKKLLLAANPDEIVDANPLATEIPDAPAHPAAAPAHPSTLPGWIVASWLAGALASLLWICAGWLIASRLGRNSQAASDGALTKAFAEIAAELGVRRPVRLLLSDDHAMPMTWGIWRLVVLLPRAAETWSAERLRLVLIHELAHVMRRDCLWQMLAYLSRGLFWFHPLAWVAARQMRIEQEQACDDWVLASGASGPDYAEHLLAVTAGLSENVWAAPAALGMAQADHLHRRLVGLLDAKRSHAPVGRRAAFLAVGLALAAALFIGAGSLAPRAEAARAVAPMHRVQIVGGKEDSLLTKLGEIQEKLAKHYVAPVDQKVLVDSALKGLLGGLKDPYADYLSADELRMFDSQVKGSLVGIGVQLKMDDDRVTVITPLEDSPALKAGLRPGDVIDAIDGKKVAGLGMADVVGHILGAAGTPVKLKIVHPDGVVQEVPITRGELRFRSVHGFQRGPDGAWRYLIDPDRKIGFLTISQFTSHTSEETRDAIKAMQAQGMKGLILCLRNCPGGLLEQAVEVAKLFLDKGTIVTTKAPGKEEMKFTADGKTALGDFPLIVLVNEKTASAAEIVAGALRDHERAVLLGTRTFGKGSVQSVMKLDAGGALKITTAYHYLPSGRNIQKRPGEKTWGVDPTDGFYVPMSPAQTKAMLFDEQHRFVLGLSKDEQPPIEKLTPRILEEKHSDPQLAAALRAMVARLTGGEFVKVGRSNAAMIEQLLRLEDLRRRRDQLQQNLRQVESEIDNLDRGPSQEKAPMK